MQVHLEEVEINRTKTRRGILAAAQQGRLAHGNFSGARALVPADRRNGLVRRSAFKPFVGRNCSRNRRSARIITRVFQTSKTAAQTARQTATIAGSVEKMVFVVLPRRAHKTRAKTRTNETQQKHQHSQDTTDRNKKKKKKKWEQCFKAGKKPRRLWMH